MSLGQQFHIEIVKIHLDVKFNCIISLKIKDQILATSDFYSEGSFIFNQQICIKIDDHIKNSFWEAAIVLKTERGTNYTTGFIKLAYSDLEAIYDSQHLQLPLSKCYDQKAFCELKLIKIIQMSQMNSELPFKNIYQQSSAGNENRPQWELKSYQSRQELGIKLFPSYLIRNVSEVMKRPQIIEKSRQKQSLKNSRKVQMHIGSDLETRRLRQKINELSANNIKKQKIIKQLQEKNKRLANELNEIKARNISNYNIELKSHNDLIQQNSELKKKVASLSTKLSESENQIQKLSDFWNPEILKASVLQKEYIKRGTITLDESKINEKNELIMEKERELQLIKGLYDQQKADIMKKNQQAAQQAEVISKLQTKVKQLQMKVALSNKQVDYLFFQCNQYKLLLGQLDQTNKTNKILQQEIKILKRNAHKSLSFKQDAFMKLEADQKNYKQSSTIQVNRVKQENDQIKKLCNELEGLNKILNEKVKDLGRKNTEGSNQLTRINGEAIKKQKQCSVQKQLIAKLQLQNNSLIEQVASLQQANKNWCNELEQNRKQTHSLSEKNKKLLEELSALQYSVKQYELQFAIKQISQQSVHIKCKQEQQKMKQIIERSEASISELLNQVQASKMRIKQSQRLCHELRLLEGKSREERAKMIEKLGQYQKRCLKFERDIKEKLIIVEQTEKSKQKLLQANKELQRKLYEKTKQTFASLEKKLKATTEFEQSSIRIMELEQQLHFKGDAIEKLETIQLELRKMLNLEKERVVKCENQMRMMRRENQRYRSQIMFEVSQILNINTSLERNKDSKQAVQQLIGHHKSTTARLQAQLIRIKKESEELTKKITEKEDKMNKLEKQLHLKNQQTQQMKKMMKEKEREIDNKDEMLEALNQEHNQLLSIHQQYIFTFNRYKVDKQEDIDALLHELEKQKQNSEQLLLLKQEGNKELQDKNNQIYKIKIENTNLEFTIKSLKKQLLQKTEKSEQAISAKANQELKLAKTIEQLNYHMNLSNQLSLKNQSLVNEVQILKKQIVQKKQMMDFLTKAKQKWVKQSLHKDQRIQTLEKQAESMQEGMERINSELETSKLEKEGLKSEIKLLKSKIKEKQEMLSSLKDSKDKAEEKARVKSEQGEKLKKKLRQMESQYQKAIKQTQNISKLLLTKSEQLTKMLEKQKNYKEEFEEKEKKTGQNLTSFENEKAYLLSNVTYLQQQIDTYRQREASLMSQNQAQLEQLQELRKRILDLEGVLCEKEQSIFTLSGQISEIEIQWENEKRRFLDKEISLREEMERKLQECRVEEEQKMFELEIKVKLSEQSVDEKKKEISYLSEVVEKLKRRMKEQDEHSNRKSKLFEQQLNKIYIQNKRKNEKLQSEIKIREEKIQKLQKSNKELIEGLEFEKRKQNKKQGSGQKYEKSP